MSGRRRRERPRRAVRRVGELVFDSSPAGHLLRAHRRRMLDRALERGLPPAVGDPLRWLAGGELAAEDAQRIERVEARRAALAARGDETAPSPGGREVSLRHLALGASVDRRFGPMLYLLARAIGARTALELGSCVGIGTAYLASGATRVVSVEASPERAAIAASTADSVSDGVEVVTGYFDDVLPGILERLEDEIDIAWIDGHHQHEATLRYFDAIRPRLREGAVVAFDDIRWSADMLAAWRTLEHAESFAQTIDLGPIGIGIRGAGEGGPVTHDLRGIFGRPRWLHRRGDRPR